MTIILATLVDSLFQILLAILVDLPSPMIPAKVQPKGILGSGWEDF